MWVYSVAVIAMAVAVPPHLAVTRIATGFRFAEGPVVDDHDNLYFTDQRDRGGKIYRLDPTGKLDLLVADAGRANGLAINSRQELVACQANGCIVAYTLDGANRRVVASGYRGRRFNAPNDLVIDEHDGIYFTDPSFGAPRPLPQRTQAVYYVAADGTVTRVIDHLDTPNGIGLSPDMKTLYVVSSLEREVMAYPILAPGQLGPGRVFARMAPSGVPLYIGGDGMAVDVAGNLWITSHRGVQVFDPCGGLLHIVAVPESPTNVAFGRDGTMNVTARHSVYRAR